MEKVIWTKNDNFDSIHKKLLKLVGKDVLVKKNITGREISTTIFNVSDITESHFEAMGDGFFKFLEGDLNYSTKNGDYNFKGNKIIPVWEFIIEYGTSYNDGCRMTMPYKFKIPRKSNYEEDLKECGLVVDDNHPFIFYDFN